MDDLNDLYEVVTDIAEAQLISSVKKGEPWAIKYWLSTKGKDRGYTTKQEATFNSSYPMQIITEGVADSQMQVITTGVEGEDDDKEKLKM